MVTRIRELLEAHQLSPTQFADFIGVGRPVISHILSERNEPSLKVVQKVINAFPEVSLAWLVSGSGPMLKTPAPDSPPPTTSASSSTPVASPAASLPSISLPPAALPGPFTPSPAAPAPALATTPAPVAAAITAPLAALAATQLPRLPQPPRFRPGATAQPYSLPAPNLPPAAPVPPPSATEVPSVAIAPALPAEAVASTLAGVASVGLPPARPVVAAPAFSELAPAHIRAEAGPAPTADAMPVATSVAPAASSAPARSVPSPTPAAAFSLLGEAGKTIRRIVLFYGDGSFSDYRPEGQ
ncbi:MAG: helix-turn-helix domain-containing protein [Hymenobacter sp.]|nr:MAG: helix-turn-helix domain-containing protein [Hymenobacter sp.]